MDRNKFLLKRRIKYMIMLFFIFMALLLVFDFIVYSVCRSTIYEESDNQITEAKEQILENPQGAIENFLNGKQIVYYDNGSNYVISYKVFLLVRDEDGNILNSDYLTSFDYMLSLEFPLGQEDQFITEHVERNNDELYYRTYMFAVPGENDRIYYVQMATDTTDIELSLTIVKRVLALGTVIAMGIVLIIGWYLSKSLVKGVVEAWERQDEFISYASHEIRSPLAVVHSSLELLLETPGAKIIDRSDLILNSLSETSRLRKMTNNLLEMVKLQASELPLHKEKIDIKQMVEDFIEPFVYQAEATGKILKYHVEDSVTMVADRQLITELLVIFLENALKYTETGDLIQLMVSRVNDTVVICVEDSGVGISDEGMSKVFSRFYREERQQSKSDGSGLGLYIAGLIVQAHGGRVRAEHNHPKGTVFVTEIKAK